jgi:glycosyltransferase involved in cell wall biosynthesis
MQNQPRISVIIAVFNAQSTLQQCLDSVVQQAYKNVELIVIDGGSTDGSLEILNRNAATIHYWVSEPDRGIYHAWNKALQKASGDWICFLGADDYFWTQNVLANVASRLSQLRSNIQLAYGQVMLLTASGEPIYPIGQAWPDIGSQLKKIMCIPHPGTMHRRSFFDMNGNFDETYRIAGDYEIFLRGLTETVAEAVFIPDLIIVGMRHGGLSSNPANSLLAMHEMRLAQKKYGQRWPDKIWVLAMLRIYGRFLVWRLVGERAGKRMIDFARRVKGLPPYWSKV